MKLTGQPESLMFTRGILQRRDRGGGAGRCPSFTVLGNAHVEVGPPSGIFSLGRCWPSPTGEGPQAPGPRRRCCTAWSTATPE